MYELDRFLAEHRRLSRRYFLRMGALGAAALAAWPKLAHAQPPNPALAKAGAALDPYLTPPADFRDVSRGKPLPHSLADEKKTEVGLTRDTWKLEVISDPDHPAKLGREFKNEDNTALDFAGLLQLAEKHAVRFAKVMTCLNIGCPLGMGIWEGVPLRDIIWLTKPREDIRRVFYYGYHNDDPKQMFLSSLPLGRVLEDPYDLPPVIVCYKLNGQWLNSQRGGPVRIVVPEAYGFKSIKWLSHVVLTNLASANDTYINGNNDVDSPLKSFAATLSVPDNLAADQPLAISGYAQVGISGLSKVQVWLSKSDEDWPGDDPHFTKAPWIDAEILAPPKSWRGDLPEDGIRAPIHGFDEAGQPRKWPMRLAKAHWAVLLPGQKAGNYTFRCRTVDEKGIAQPMPRPYRKSGHAAIEAVSIKIRGNEKPTTNDK